MPFSCRGKGLFPQPSPLPSSPLARPEAARGSVSRPPHLQSAPEARAQVAGRVPPRDPEPPHQGEAHPREPAGGARRRRGRRRAIGAWREGSEQPAKPLSSRGTKPDPTPPAGEGPRRARPQGTRTRRARSPVRCALTLTLTLKLTLTLTARAYSPAAPEVLSPAASAPAAWPGHPPGRCGPDRAGLC